MKIKREPLENHNLPIDFTPFFYGIYPILSYFAKKDQKTSTKLELVHFLKIADATIKKRKQMRNYSFKTECKVGNVAKNLAQYFAHSKELVIE